MSSNPLPLPEIWSDLPKGDAPESARPEFPANSRSGLVLVDYAGGNAQSDSPPLARPLDRAERALAADAPVPGPASAALAKGLSDLTAIVTQAEALLRAQGILKGDVYFAVERIHDVALALRMRDVNAALCDTLDASVREVGDAVVRHEAAATGALSAAALLGDIMHRIEELMRVVAAGAEPVAGPSTAEATSANAPPAPPTPGAKAVVAALASVTFETQIVDDIPLPFAREESSLEAPMPAVASQAQATNDLPPAVAAEVSADSAEEQSREYVAGPLAYASPVPMADLPVTAAVDSVAADGVLSEGAVSTGAMAERTTSEDVLSEGVAPEEVTPDAASVDATETRAFRDALSDELTLGNETLREPQPVGETDDPRSNPAEQLAAAAHLQNEINIPAEIVAAQSVPVETVAVESAAAETVAAEAVAAEMVPAETIAAETVAAKSVAAELVAAGPADDQDQPIAAPVVEATTATIPAAMGEGDPNQLSLSAVAGKDATATETVIRRPASDPLAAFYGLSEEELIALFT